MAFFPTAHTAGTAENLRAYVNSLPQVHVSRNMLLDAAMRLDVAGPPYQMPDPLVTELAGLLEEMLACLDTKMVERHDSGTLAVFGIKHSDADCSLCKARALLARALRRPEP